MLPTLGRHQTHQKLPLETLFPICSSQWVQNMVFFPLEILRNLRLANFGSKERWTLSLQFLIWFLWISRWLPKPCFHLTLKRCTFQYCFFSLPDTCNVPSASTHCEYCQLYWSFYSRNISISMLSDNYTWYLLQPTGTHNVSVTEPLRTMNFPQKIPSSK